MDISSSEYIETNKSDTLKTDIDYAEKDYGSSFDGWLHCVTENNEGIWIKLRKNNRFHIFKWLGSPEYLNEITPQSIISLSGISKVGEDVISANTVFVIHKAKNLPENVSIDTPDLTDLDHRHLHIRSNALRATALFRHYVFSYAKQFLDGIDCIQVQTPILTEASCVCSGDVFTFPYYGKRIATLIQSPWMYADALTSGLERVYALNPSFRRERDQTNIHLVEIWQLQVDLAWNNNDDIMKIEEALVRHIAKNLLENHQDLYAMADLSMDHLRKIDLPFFKVSYDETVELLNREGCDFSYGDDYSKEQTEILARLYDRPFFITDFPQQIKNFWFPIYKDRPNLTPSNDLFAHTGHGELIGGGSRVSDAEELQRNLSFFGHDEDEFDWFVDTRKFGCAPHAGFSMGFDRLCSFFMGVNDIRKAALFPRIPNGPIKP